MSIRATPENGRRPPRWVMPLCGAYLVPGRNLNLGCGRNPWDGWVNLDRKPGAGVDLVATVGVDPIPLPTSSMSLVLANQVLEHIPDIISAMREIHRVLEPNGVLVAATPYAGSNGAWEDPTHVRAFTEHSWGFFDRRMYTIPDQPGYYDSDVDYIFEVIKIDLVPEPRWREEILAGRITEQALREKMTHERNIVQEIQAHLRAVKEVSA